MLRLSIKTKHALVSQREWAGTTLHQLQRLAEGRRQRHLDREHLAGQQHLVDPRVRPVALLPAVVRPVDGPGRCACRPAPMLLILGHPFIESRVVSVLRRLLTERTDACPEFLVHLSKGSQNL